MEISPGYNKSVVKYVDKLNRGIRAYREVIKNTSKSPVSHFPLNPLIKDKIPCFPCIFTKIITKRVFKLPEVNSSPCYQ